MGQGGETFVLNSFGSLKATGSFWSDEWRGGFESSGVTLCKGWGEIRPKGMGLDTPAWDQAHMQKRADEHARGGNEIQA